MTESHLLQLTNLLAHKSFFYMKTILPVLLAAFVLTGCSSLNLMMSDPPYEKIVVNKNQEVGGALGGFVPKGEYVPVYEDKRVIYYEAPSKVRKKLPGFFSSGLYNGGIMVTKETPEDRGTMYWWYMWQSDTPIPLGGTLEEIKDEEITFFPAEPKDKNSEDSNSSKE